MEVAQTLGKYEIRGTLGRGAMGIVYEGWDPLIARRVAIKAVRLPEHPETETDEAIARFRREAQAAGRLTHPNIVGVYDYGETGELAYIVMEFVDGTTLKHLLDRQERFAVADIGRIMQDVLSGLQYSHARGVVHRDIKPANIMLTSTAQAKIADFGIARIESSSMTQAGTVLGTPAYMSPEQFTGQVVTERTDIYSAGVLLYQLLTGEKPFEGSVTTIMHKVLNTDPPPPSQLAVTSPVALDAVVRRAMSKRPEDRYPSAVAFAESIALAVAARPAIPPAEPEAEATVVSTSVQPSPRPAASPARSPPPDSKRSGLPLFIAAGVAGIAVLATGGWWFMQRPAPPAQVAAVQQPAGQSVGPSAQATSPPSASAKPTEQVSTTPLRRQASTATPPPVPQANATASAPAATAPSSAAAPSPLPPAAPHTSASATPPPVPPSVAAPPSGAAPSPLPTAPANASVAATPPPALPTNIIAAAPPTSASPVAPTPPPSPTSETTGSATPSPVADRPAANQPKAEPVPTPQPSPPSPEAAASTPASSSAGVTARNPSAGSPVAAKPEQVAAISLGSLRQEIERVLASSPCTLVDSTVQDSGTVTVTGLAGRSADDAVRREVTGIAGAHALDWRVRRIDSVFCDALSAIRPVAPLAGARDMGLRLALAGGRTALHSDEYIQPRITMPSFSGRLRVDYLAHDGSLVHLYPTVADPQDHYVAVPARTLHAGEMLELGNAGGGRPQWQVAPPYGTDMMIAVASSVPLLASPQPNEEDNGADYVHRLGRAIEIALSRGASVSAAVMLVDTLPKPP